MYWLTTVNDGGAIMAFHMFCVDGVDTISAILERLRGSSLPETDTSL